jgi:hypothetical protein
MKRISKDSPGRLRGDATVVLAFVSLLFPSSASALCIGPGGHVAVEDLNAACCVHSSITVRGEVRPGDGLAGAGDCQECTDLFLTPNTRGAVLKSCDTVASNSHADAFLADTVPASTPCSSRRPAAFGPTDAPIATTASVPLRC